MALQNASLLCESACALSCVKGAGWDQAAAQDYSFAGIITTRDDDVSEASRAADAATASAMDVSCLAGHSPLGSMLVCYAHGRTAGKAGV